MFKLMKFIVLTPLALTAINIVASCSSSFENELCSLKSVVKVNKINDFKMDSFKEIYEVYFDQQIDPSNSQSEHFNQKIYIFYNGKNLINQYRITGYNLKGVNTYKESTFEDMFLRYKGNCIELEYRFFGDSVPSDFNKGGTKYYEYLTSKNACYDFHKIVNELSTILTGKKYLSGRSKGGYSTETMACYYPSDFNAYISKSAPLCDTPYDNRVFDNLFHSIGDLHYGKEKAQEYRNLMLEFIKVAFSEEFRNLIMVQIIDFNNNDKLTRIPLSIDEYYEFIITDVVCATWQNNQDFESIRSVLALPQTNETEIIYKSYQMSNIVLNETGNKSPLYIENSHTPYKVQSYMEMGNYCCDFTYLREHDINVKTLPNRDKYIFLEASITKSQIEAFSYNNKTRNEIINFLNETKDVTLIKLYGLSDIWYAVRTPEIKNDHIHVYNAKFAHKTDVSKLEEKDAKEVYEIFDNLLK